MFSRLTPIAKGVIALLVIVALVGVFQMFKKTSAYASIVPSSKITLPEGIPASTPVIRVGVVTWGGYAGGQYFNEGFKANVNSRFYKDYKFLVDFVVLDDFEPSRAAWKSGDVDVLWVTADAFPTESDGLKDYEPKFIFQSDWSRGGDAIVARGNIKTANDLKGKKVAVAFGTPSNTFLIWVLKAASISIEDIKVIQVASAVDAAKEFKAGAVDAAVVWSPDDEDCITNVPGSTVIKNTKSASNIIADGFFVKGKYLAKNHELLKHLVEGWMIGAAEINTSDVAKRKAAKILSTGLNQPDDFCYKAINNTRLTTIGDNRNFFNVNGNYQGVKGEDLYSDMSIEYAKLGIAPPKVPGWRVVSDSSLIKEIILSGQMHAAEGTTTFVTSEKDKNATAFSTKRITVSFASGSSKVSEDARVVIEREFGGIAKAFGNSKVRIEGNTDSVGSHEGNVELSKARANAVADFLSKRYNFNKNRFVIIGNGPDKPIASNDDENGKSANRRTDFEIIN